MNRLLPLLASLLVALSSPAAAPDSAWTVVAPDGCWNVFTDPRALVSGDRLYAGWVSVVGSVQVGAFDLKRGLPQYVTVADRFEANDFASPALLLRPDGRLMVFYAHHGRGDLHARTAARTGQITQWEPERALGLLPAGAAGPGLALPQPALLATESNALHLFYRGADSLPAWTVSHDLGATWQKPRPLLRRSHAGSDARPYLKIWSDGAGRIDLLFTDGHPQQDPSNAVRFVRYERGAFWRADGTRIAGDADLPLDPAACDVVYGGGAGPAWLGQVAEDRDGRPVAAYVRSPKPDDHRYAYARWDGKAWTDHELCAGGPGFPKADAGKPAAEPYFAGGLALDPADPATVYLSRPVDGRFEIERWATADGGATWKTEAVTAGSARDNVRPVAVAGAAPGGPGLLWLNLRHYSLYTDYDAQVLANVPTRGGLTIRAQLAPGSVRATLEAVADWQIAHPGRYRTTDWTQGALYAGMMALAGISPNPRYREAMLAVAEQNGWRPGERTYHADDHAVGQTYAELYAYYREERMLAPLRARFDEILAHPATNALTFSGPHEQITRRWSWCDALFMAPPAWLRLYRATGDRRYRDFAVAEWQATSAFLYDREEHLFYRDSRYFPQREANGRKVFWSRGNGWVLGGLVRVLEALPAEDPDRGAFVAQFREMAAAVLARQQEDGLWRSSLLDPASYPLQETSGSGFFTYALAWGVNQGLLDRATYEPAVRRGWEGLVRCVNPDGRLTHVQPIGADPKQFDGQQTEVYGVGAFLLAGTEIFRLSLADATHSAAVDVRNTVDAPRGPETVELPWAEVVARLGSDPGTAVAVLDRATSRLLDRQVYDADGDGRPDQLLCQCDFLPGETRHLLLVAGLNEDNLPPPALTTHGRFVPERKDDYAWENDRIAYRVYGPALQHTPGEVSGSGIDVWLKSTRRPVIEDWYARGDYHEDHGEGLDAYKVGTTRGCGGLGVRVATQLANSANFSRWRRIADGPIRTAVELEYEPWTAGDGQVRETKRISLDRGSNLNRIESVLTAEPARAITAAIGLTSRNGQGGAMQAAEREGWLAYTEPEAAPNGRTHVALVMPGALTMAQDDENLLATRVVNSGDSITYFAGAGWSKADFPTPEAWQRYVQLFAWNRAHPLDVRWPEAAAAAAAPSATPPAAPLKAP